MHHAEDCLSARALLALRDEGAVPAVVRTVHHVDDFASPVLQDCQRGVDRGRGPPHLREPPLGRRPPRATTRSAPTSSRTASTPPASPAARSTAPRPEPAWGWGGRPAVLAIGGIEPRKGSRTLLAAFARTRAGLGPGALLAIAGGETLFDYADYRAAWEADAARLGLRVHRGPAPPGEADVAVLGPVPDADMPALYRAADAFAFPSEREGFGLVVLEAQASGLPVVTSDLPVLREFLSPDKDCLMVPAGDARRLADALAAAVRDAGLRERLVAAGRATAARFTWTAAAEAHERGLRLVREPPCPCVTITSTPSGRPSGRGGWRPTCRAAAT